MNRQLLQRTFYFLLMIGLASAALAKPAHARPTRPTRHAHVARLRRVHMLAGTWLGCVMRARSLKPGS